MSLKLAADNDTRSLGGENHALGVYLVPETRASHISDNWSTPDSSHSLFWDDNDSVDEGELGPITRVSPFAFQHR